jgi:hypothetical protein
MTRAAYVAEVEVWWGCHRRQTYWPVGVCDPDDGDDYDRIDEMVQPFYDAVDALLVAAFGVNERFPSSAYRSGDADLDITFHRLWDEQLAAGYPPPGYERIDDLPDGLPRAVEVAP